MKNNILKIFLALILFTAYSCNREGDHLTFDESSHGIFLRTVANNSTIFDQNGFTTNKVDLELELAGPSAVNNFQELRMYVDYDDSEGVYAANEKLVATHSLSDFTLNSQSGLYRRNFEYTAQELFQLLGITDPAVYDGGDFFELRFEVVTKDGKVFTDSNLGLDMLNAYYASPFAYKFNVVCPFDLSIFNGDFSVVADAWADYAPGTVLQVLPGAAPNQVIIPANLNPYISNGATAHMILTIDNDGNVVVTSNEDFDYTGFAVLPITGDGSVNFCNGDIELVVNYGAYAGYSLVLSKL